MFRIFLFFILLFSCLNLLSQNFCGHKGLPISKKEMKEVIRLSRLGQTKAIGCRENNVYTVPVVIHIMHTGQAIGSNINISDAQASSLISALNRDFRSTHSISQRGVAVDTRIDFCLAKQDPSGNPTSGITRHDCSSVGNYATRGVKVFTAGTGGVTPRSIASRPGATWDVNKYLNIWVINEIDNQGQNNINSFSGGYLGFAPLSPTAGTNPNTMWNTNMADPDGGIMPGVAGCFIVASACLGVETSAQASAVGYFYWNQRLAYQGRVGTHEIGHYFGLPHTFSDFNPNVCSNGDGIGDTGNAKVVGNACSSGCGGQNGENYMDYNNQTCIGEFTAGQRTVMRSRLSGGFSAMSQCNFCKAKYDLSIDNVTVNKNDCNLKFTGNIDVTNIGTQTLTNFKIRYRVNTGAWIIYTWTGSLLSGSSTTINIPNVSGVNGANNFQVEVRTNTLNTNKNDQEVSNNTGNRNFTMNQPPPVSVSASNTAICVGGSTNLSGSGSSSYSWNQSLGSGANKTVSPITTKIYTVTGTTSGCNTTASIQIVVNQLPTVSTSNLINETCQDENASFTAVASSGQGPYQFALGNGAYSNNASFSGLNDGAHILKIKDANNCESIPLTVNITNTGGFFSSVSNDSSICNGQNAMLEVTTTTSGLTYSWSNSLPSNQSQTVAPTATTAYSVIVADQSGCSRTHSSVVTVVEFPTINTSLSSVILCRNETVGVSASGADAYIWNTNGSSSSTSVTFPSSLDSISVVGINEGICSTYYAIPIFQSNMNTSITPNATICEGETIEVEVTTIQAPTGGVDYIWTQGLSNSNNHNVSPTVTTVYDVVIQDVLGCEDTLSSEIVVVEVPNLVLSTDSVALCQGDSVVITASGASEFVWGNGEITSSIQLKYPVNIDSIVISGVNGGICFDVESVKIVESFMSNSITQPLVICSGDSVELSVESNDSTLNFLWNNGLPNQSSHVVSPTDTTVYNVVITDFIGCEDELITSIEVLQSPNLSLSNSQITLCALDSVDVIVSGAEKYSWNTGDTTSVARLKYPTGLDSLVVYGVNGGACIRKIGIPIFQSQLDASISGEQHICLGSSVTLLVVANISGLNYNWNNGLGNSNFHSVYPSTTTEYSVEVVDDLGCVDSLATTVYVDSMPILVVEPTSINLCEGDSVIIEGSGASAYSWSTGDSISSISYVVNHTTTLTLTGMNGVCHDNLSIPIQASPSASVVASSNVTSINTGGSIQFYNTGSTASSYLWDFGDGSSTSLGSPPHAFNFPGAYFVKLSGFEGSCTNVDTVLVYVGTVSVDENSLNQISVYPNPSTGVFNLLPSQLERDVEFLTIYNSLGELVYSNDKYAYESLDLSFLAEGIYVLSLTFKEKKHFIKIVVKK